MKVTSIDEVGSSNDPSISIHLDHNGNPHCQHQRQTTFTTKNSQIESDNNNIKMPFRKQTQNAEANHLNPMKFPKEDEIPTTEQALRSRGVTHCMNKVLAKYQCLAKARESYLAEGLDTMKGPDWYYYHLKMCFEPHKAANQCIIDHREAELRERHKRIREKRLSSVANFSG